MAKSQMVSVYPIRYIKNNWEHLIIKRATIAYNWQCVTGGVEEGETPLEAAHRELFEETGYKTEKINRFNYGEDYFIDDESAGQRNEELLKIFLESIENIVFIAEIQQNHDPVIDPKEHTDWLWCDYKTAYEKILWSIEKKQHRIIYEYLKSTKL